MGYPRDLFDNVNETLIDTVIVPGQNYLSIYTDCLNFRQFMHLWLFAGSPHVEYDGEAFGFDYKQGDERNGGIIFRVAKADTSRSAWDEHKDICLLSDQAAFVGHKASMDHIFNVTGTAGPV